MKAALAASLTHARLSLHQRPCPCMLHMRNTMACDKHSCAKLYKQVHASCHVRMRPFRVCITQSPEALPVAVLDVFGGHECRRMFIAYTH